MAYDINDINPVYTDYISAGYENSDSTNIIEWGKNWLIYGIPEVALSAANSVANSVTWLGHKVGSAGYSLYSWAAGEDGDDQPDWVKQPYQVDWSFGGRSQERQEWLDEHRGAVEFWGFLAGSIVPGGAAVKGLRWAQKGLKFAPKHELTLGLLSNQAERAYLQKGAIEILNQTPNVLKYRAQYAMASAAQLGLESVAFEIGAYGVLHQAPVYDDIDSFSDFAARMATTSVFGGVLGGLVGLARFKGASFNWVNPENQQVIREGTSIRKLTQEATDIQKVVDEVRKFDAAHLIDTPLDTTTFARGLEGKRAMSNSTFSAGDALLSALRNSPAKSAADIVHDIPEIQNAMRGYAAATAQQVRTARAELLAKLTEGSAPGFGEALERLGLDAQTNVLLGAKKVSRPAFEGAGRYAEDAMYFNMENGWVTPNAIPLAGDLFADISSALSAKNIRNGFAKLGKKGNATIYKEHTAGWTSKAIRKGEAWQVQFAFPWAKRKAELFAEQMGITEIITPKSTNYSANFPHLDKIDSLLSNRSFAKNLADIEAEAQILGRSKIDGVVLSGQRLDAAIKEYKLQVAQDLIKSGMGLDEVAVRLNLKESALAADPAKWLADDFINGIDAMQQRIVQVSYATGREQYYWNKLGEIALDTKIKLATQQQKATAKAIIGEDLPDLGTRFLSMFEDGFTGLFGAANPAYESAAEFFTYIGKRVQDKATKFADARNKAMLASEEALRNLGTGTNASVAVNSIHNRLRGSTHQFVLSADRQYLVNVKYFDDLGHANPLPMGVADEHIIPLNPGGVLKAEELKAVTDYFAARIDQNKIIVDRLNALKAARGEKLIEHPASLYAPPPPLKNRQNVAIMINSATGDKTMLFGKTARALDEEIARARRTYPSNRIVTSKDTAAFYKNLDDYDAALDWSGIARADANKSRSGTMQPTFGRKSFQDLDDWNSWATYQEHRILKMSLELHYGQELAELAAKAASSSPSGAQTAFAKAIGTMTGNLEVPSIWNTINSWVSNTLDDTLATSWGAYIAAKRDKISWQEAQNISARYGVNAFENPEVWKAAGTVGWEGTSMALQQSTNALLRTTILGLDAISTLVNIIGTPILMVPEIKAAIASGADVGYLKPIARALKSIVKNDDGRLAMLKEWGVVDDSISLANTLGEGASRVFGAKTAKAGLAAHNQLESAWAKAFRIIQTPYSWSERMTRAVAALAGMDVALMKGMAMGSPEMRAYVLNFANKSTGNYVASQRPQMFKGIIGSAIGVFQSYQLNYLQQLMRHIEESPAKRAAMMLGLQGTIFGAQSVPGYNLINKYLVENANDEYFGLQNFAQSANFDSNVGFVTNNIGDSITYGLPSVLLNANLWVRGDANPRTMTVVPTTMDDLAVVSAFKTTTNSLVKFAQNMLNGGSLKVSGAELLAHNGLNRPLAGVGEYLLGARTTRDGAMIVPIDDDLFSMATAVRFLGAKPMNEAVATETFYRFSQIHLSEQRKMGKIGSALRTQIMSGGDVDFDSFFKAYSEQGGNPQTFRRWYMNILKSVDTGRAKQLSEKMRNSPYARAYQQIIADEYQD